MRELVEEAQAAERRELLLLVDLRIRLAQLLVDPGELGSEVQPGAVTSLGLLHQGTGAGLLDFLGHARLQRVDRRGGGIHDLVQELREVRGLEGPGPGQQFIHHRTQGVEVGAVGEIQALHLLGRHVGRTARDAFDARHV